MPLFYLFWQLSVCGSVCLWGGWGGWGDFFSRFKLTNTSSFSRATTLPPHSLWLPCRERETTCTPTTLNRKETGYFDRALPSPHKRSDNAHTFKPFSPSLVGARHRWRLIGRPGTTRSSLRKGQAYENHFNLQGLTLPSLLLWALPLTSRWRLLGARSSFSSSL